MNANKETKLLSTLALILAIAIAPMSTAAFAQEDSSANVESDVSTSNEVTIDIEVDDREDDSNTSDETRKDKIKEKMDELREKRAEKIEEFKDKVKDTYQDRLRTDVRPDTRPYDVALDRVPDLTFSGKASGWTMIGGHAWESSTSLPHGEAWHIRGDIWKVHSKGTLDVAGRSVDVELKGFANGHRLTLHGTGYIGEDPIRVFIRGHYAPTVVEGEFAIAFTQMGVQNQNTGAKFTMAQVGSVTVTQTGTVPIPKPLPYDTPLELFQ